MQHGSPCGRDTLQSQLIPDPQQLGQLLVVLTPHFKTVVPQRQVMNKGANGLYVRYGTCWLSIYSTARAVKVGTLVARVPCKLGF